MNQGKRAYNYFKSKFQLYESTRGWYRFNFPLDLSHSDISAGVHFKLGFVKDHRTGYKASILKFISDYEEISYIEAKKLLGEYQEADINFEDFIKYKKPVSKLTLPKGYKTLLEGTGNLANRARRSFEKRGFDVELLDNLGFGYVNDEEDDFFGYLIIPFKKQGKLVYFIGRDFIGNKIKYRNPDVEETGLGKSELIFNEDALYIYDEVFLTEGWADAMTMGEEGIATLGWDLSSDQKNIILKSPCKVVNIIPDKGVLERTDLTFYQKAKNIAMKLMPHKKVRIIDVEKISDPGKDVNEFGRQVVIELLQETPFVSYSNLLSI